MNTNNVHTRETYELDNAEDVTDVRMLDVGDKIIVGDRTKPLTVTYKGYKQEQELDNGREYTRWAIAAKGDWKNAKAIEVHNAIELRGWLGHVIDEASELCNDLGQPIDVQLVEMVDPYRPEEELSFETARSLREAQV